MDHWRVPYLGLRQIPSDFTAFELDIFFTFSPKEIELIDSRRSDLYRLALALHIGFVRMAGRTLDAYKQIPKVLWKHLAERLNVPSLDIGTLRSLYETRPRTLVDHQQLAYQCLGFGVMTEHQRRYLVRWLKEMLNGRPNSTMLLNQVKTWLYEHRILIAGDRFLRTLIAEAVRTHEDRLEEVLLDTVGSALLDYWSERLVARTQSRISLQEWLWSVPVRNSTVQMYELFGKVEYLRLLHVDARWPEAINESLISHYARRCASRTPSANKRLAPQTRRIEAACFMRYSLCAATDHLLQMLRRWLADVTNDAGKQIDNGRRDDAKTLSELVQAIKELAASPELAADELRASLQELADKALPRRASSRRKLVRLQLMTKSTQARKVLRKLVALPFASETPHRLLDALAVLRELYGKDDVSNGLPHEVQIDLGRPWHDLIHGQDRVNALRAFEWATLFGLRVALRNGSVYINHSFSFRSRTTLLIPSTEWQSKRNHFYGHLALPQDPQVYLDQIVKQLNQGMKRLDAASRAGEVSIDNDGVHLARLAPDIEDVHVATLRRAIFEGRPTAQLPRVLLDIDSHVRFSWILLGREPQSRSELLLTYAAILAHGTSLSAADVSRMIPELSSQAIRQMMDKIADERLLRDASDAVLAYMHRHPVAAHWGRGDLASADMMSLETSRSVWQARADPRRRTPSIGVYTHVRDRWGVFYDQPILLKERQAGAALEGVVRQGSTSDVAQLAVDTHGYTDFAMAMAKALQFDLCPRLAHLRERRLCVPKGLAVPSSIVPVATSSIDLDVIRDNYDEFVRVAASIQNGRCTAVQALQRFGSEARSEPVYAAGVALGRLLRTIFLIDYHTNASFRRELQHALNRGEAVHVVQRAIHIGKIPTDLAKRPEALNAVSSSLSLLTNAVMAWNTRHMQQAVDQIEARTGEALVPDDLRRIAPTALEGINLRGTFDFPLAEYEQRILPTSSAVPATGT
jgi:TnpA family transposase